jgi:hypothetical protein
MPAVNQVNASGFDHSLHSGAKPDRRAELERKGGVPACGDCHVVKDASNGVLSRPGSNEHAPCDRCHKDKFFQPPGAFCKMCHSTVDPRAAGGARAEMHEWPPRAAARRYAAVFSHRLHLDHEKMEKQVGFHTGCRECHVRKLGTEKAEVAGHSGCAPCHGKGKLKITMQDCRSCHVDEGYVVPQGRRFITGDLKFSHARHEIDLAGKPISCTSCHTAVADAPDVEHINLPAMIDCARCHEDSAKTPDTARISNCSVCHSQLSAGVAPRNHLGGSRAPDTHTIAFRTDHAEAARSAQARCRFCHGGMSSTTRDNCFECHTVMKPRDHSLRWATYDHGPEAAMNRSRCASCHEADYCARCHSQRPRSHTPFDSFVNGGHSTEARLNMRSCFACHTFDDTCRRCHNSPAFPGGRP